MYILRIEHPVPDFDAWKAAFDRDPVGREKSGVRRYRILRPVDNANYVMIDLEFNTMREAEALLAALRGLWGRVEGTIMMNPQAQIVEVVEAGGTDAKGKRITYTIMNESLPTSAPIPPVLRVAAGEDRFGEYRGLGISSIAFKVVPQDNTGLLILENTFRAKGGPARHLHYDQDEWFYAVEGEFIIEVGQDRVRLKPGDSLLAPRQVPHVWAYVGDTRGRMLIAFMPAGKMEAFFREVTRANAMPPQDPELWRAHGMELLGSPLAVE